MASLRLGLILWWMAGTCLQAEIWTLTNSERIEGQFAGLYGPFALISQPRGLRWLPVSTLSDESLWRVSEAKAAKPADNPAWANATGTVAKNLKGKLQVWSNGKLAKFEPGTRKEPRFYLVYFGAHWCPPCVKFSPKLVTAYQDLKRTYGEEFEVIFVSCDRDGSEQKTYVEKVGMPWPIVKFSSLGAVESVQRWAASGIPNLVALTSDGGLLYHSYQNGEYLGPDSVLEKFGLFLKISSDHTSPQYRRAFHRLEVLRHIRSAGNGSLAPQPYLLTQSGHEFKKMEVKTLQLSLTIDEQGRVMHSDLLTQVSAVERANILAACDQWLFLPRVENGIAVGATLNLPISL